MNDDLIDTRTRRWRLALGPAADDPESASTLEDDDAAMDVALSALYDAGTEVVDAGHPETSRGGGLDASAPHLARWLTDIRRHFPASVVELLQADAIDRFDLTRLLLAPQLRDALTPNVHLAGILLTLQRQLGDSAREAARAVVATVVADLEARLSQRVRSAVGGALQRSARSSRPRSADIDWNRTIRANLRHYQPELGTVVPQRLIGFGRQHRGLAREVVLVVDQSGSMAASVVYASLFAAVLASIRSLRTSLVLFDTAVVDLSDRLTDAVDILMGVRLGGGTDIEAALAYAQQLIDRPRDTIVVLISDLHDGGNREDLIRRASGLIASGTQLIVLLGLSDEGTPDYEHDTAQAFAALGVAVFAASPDEFPDLMAAALEGKDPGAVAGRGKFVPRSPDR